ncbi:hypothetical protein PR048_014322 [Dryococelus australis]|uniref:CCHC-type domain-containing protein n=1 Tax=Dryococelus australis TaxID=614101 RepID=A0ABQ9HDV4_9NEOP|nr:hypothetical protein PR048_014322 [Dryococelus australis]
MSMASEYFAHVEKLKGHSDFSIWKFQIVVLLKAVDLNNVVSTEVRGGEQDTNWGKEDGKPQRYIVRTIYKCNIQFIMSCDSSMGMFDKLCSIYERDSSHNKSLLLQNFFSYKIDKIASGLSDLQNLSVKLKSLGLTLGIFLTAWESTPKSDRTLSNLTARLLAEEERGHTSSTHDNVTFKTANKNIDCFKCNKRGHIARNCKKKKQLGCKICRDDNHTEQNCYSRDRNNKPSTSNRDKIAFIPESIGGNPEGYWVLDSGCTSHMINNSDSLTNVTEISKYVYQECVLKNVLYVPGLTRNLISVQKITENGGVKFTDNGVEILKCRTKITGEKDNSGKTFLSESKQTSELNLWHRRIGHFNFYSMKKLATLSSGLKKLIFYTSEIQSKTFLTSKQTRKHFGKERERERERDRDRERYHYKLYTLVCGPLDTTRDGFSSPIGVEKGGIKIDYGPAATPQLNGRAERLNSTRMNKTRAFLFNSGLEKVLWGEALCTATFLMNRNPSATVDTTPVELWYGKRPALSNQNYSGLWNMQKIYKMLGKLDKRCDKPIMVGYTTNGYRLWNSEKKEIKLSRYVTFVESTEVSATNNSPQNIIADTFSLVDSEETSLRLADNMEVRRNTDMLQDDVVDEPFNVYPSDQDTAKTSEMLDSLPETTT